MCTLVRNVKLIHNIEIKLITKIVGIIVLTPYEKKTLQIGEEEIQSIHSIVPLSHNIVTGLPFPNFTNVHHKLLSNLERDAN